MRIETDYWKKKDELEAQEWEPTDGREVLVFLMNRQIYAEAREIFLKGNLFHISVLDFQHRQHLHTMVLQMENLIFDVNEADDLP